MRLIDADYLKKFLEKGSGTLIEDALLGIIDAMPTVYDVDKIVERLEVNSMFAHADDEPFVMLDDAIKIVKSGGLISDTQGGV